MRSLRGPCAVRASASTPSPPLVALAHQYRRGLTFSDIVWFGPVLEGRMDASFHRPPVPTHSPRLSDDAEARELSTVYYLPRRTRSRSSRKGSVAATAAAYLWPVMTNIDCLCRWMDGCESQAAASSHLRPMRRK